jgi:hypothetical protein
LILFRLFDSEISSLNALSALSRMQKLRINPSLFDERIAYVVSTRMNEATLKYK